MSAAALSNQHQVVIVGAGPAATCTAMFLKQKGIHSVLVEKEQFPRYHIGESFTGETGGQLRKLGMEAVLDKLEYPVKLGTKVWGTGGQNSGFWSTWGQCGRLAGITSQDVRPAQTVATTGAATTLQSQLKTRASTCAGRVARRR